MEVSPSSAPGLKRSLSVWAAVGLSVALMAPSMAAREGIVAPGAEKPAQPLAAARDEAP
jgi:hypothetical protein